MRTCKFIRVALATVALAAAVLPATAAPAFAAGGNVEEYRKCVEAATQQPTEAKIEAALTKCIDAPNPLLPATGEIIWGGIAFLIVLVVLMKFAFPALRKGLKGREDKIRGDLEAAEAAKAESESLKAEYEAKLADARTEAGRIVEEARSAADAMRKDLVAKAEVEANEIKARAAEDVKAQSNRAMAELQGQVAELSIDLAEKIVERSLDRDAQRELVESYIAQVGRN